MDHPPTAKDILAQAGPWLLVVAVAVGAGLRLWRLGGKSFWLDEATSVYLSELKMAPPAERAALGPGARLVRMVREIRLSKHDAHPPLFQVVLFLFLELFGSSEVAARLPSVLAGILTIPLTYGLAERLFSRRTAWVAAGLTALSPHLVYFSQEARLYSLLVCLTVAHANLLVSLVSPGRRPWLIWCLYALAGAAGLWTYAPYGAVLVAHWGFYALYGRRARRDMAVFAAAQVVILASVLPWVPVMRQVSGKVERALAERPQERRPLRPELVASGILDAPIGLSYARRAFGFDLADGAAPRRRLLDVVVAAAWGVGAWLMLSGSARAGSKGVRLYVLCWLPVLVYLIVPMPRVHDFELKHVLFCVPLLLTAAAASLAERQMRPAPAALFAAALLAANVAGVACYLSPEFEKEPLRQLIGDIESESRPGDVLVFNPAYAQAPYHVYGRKGLAVAGPPAHFAETMTSWRPPRGGRLWLIDVYSRVARADPEPARWLGAHWRRVGAPRFYGGFMGVTAVQLFEPPAQVPRE